MEFDGAVEVVVLGFKSLAYQASSRRHYNCTVSVSSPVIMKRELYLLIHVAVHLWISEFTLSSCNNDLKLIRITSQHCRISS